MREVNTLGQGDTHLREKLVWGRNFGRTVCGVFTECCGRQHPFFGAAESGGTRGKAGGTAGTS